MLRPLPFREAATVQVDVPPNRVLEILSDPAVLRAIDPRIREDSTLRISVDGPRVEVRDRRDDLRIAFSIEAEGDGSRLSALESVRPRNPAEATKHMFFPGRVHQELEDELARLKGLLEAMGPGSG